jgi:outer membrane protein OmpA-like peptidoglycan-associated protein
MREMPRITAIVAELICWVLPTFGQAAENFFSAAGKVLKISADPRGVGMGEAQVAVADDAFALCWNPSGLASLAYSEIALTQNFWLAGIQHSSLLYGQPLSGGTLGLMIHYVSYGTFERRGIDTNNLPLPGEGTFAPSAFIAGGGYAMPVAKEVSAGVLIKLLSESIDTYSAAAISADFGVKVRQLWPGLDLGVTLSNLGAPVAGFGLPWHLRLGAAYALPFLLHPENDRCVLALDGQFPLPIDQTFGCNLGVEYWFYDIVAARMGYRFNRMLALGMGSGMRLGLGAQAFGLAFNYGLSHFGDLGLTHRISLSLRLSAPAAPEPPAVGAVESLPQEPTSDTALQAGSITKEAVGLSRKAMEDDLVPRVSGLAMRRSIAVEVKVETDRDEPTRVRNATFAMKNYSGSAPKRWTITLRDADGKEIFQQTAEGAGTIVWDGRNASGIPILDGVYAKYEAVMEYPDRSQQKFGDAIRQRPEGSSAEPHAVEKRFPKIYFAEGREDLSRESLKTLRGIAKEILSRPYVIILVEGYTAGNHQAEQSFLLAQKRVDEVVRFLTATYNIPLRNITAKSRGSRNPIASNDTEAGQSQNRRVKITVFYQQAL